jgi:uncharacterized protein YecE (DUF72 family)
MVKDVVWIGTSGWQYRDWRETFYPARLPQREWLRHYAQSFATVELNNPFYRLPPEAAFARWREATPPGFRFAVKMNRFVTHIRRLAEVEQPIALFRERVSALGEKLGPILLQLPPSLAADPGRLEAALDCMTGLQVAVEFRHDSWFREAVRSLLEQRGAALCLADTGERWTVAWRTSEWGFCRFHWGLGDPAPCYRVERLREWAERIAGLWPQGEVYCFFNNDTGACAIRDATRFARAVAEVGLRPTSVPAQEVVPLRRS